MKLLQASVAALSLLPIAAQAAEPAPLNVTLEAIASQAPISPKFAYCQPDGSGKTKPGDNISPAISWSGAPSGTQSYAIVMVDPDVPASFEDANKDGKTIAEGFPRQNFYHWLLLNISADSTGLSEGLDSKGIVQGGKPLGKTAYGVRYRNDYTKVSEGTFGGYDGPCPPWNDERLHHYHFRVYALDTALINLPENATGPQVEAQLKGHVLAQGEVVGTFTNNPKLLAK